MDPNAPSTKEWSGLKLKDVFRVIKAKMTSVTAKYCASGNGGEIYFWNFCGGQATLYYFHLVWESMPFYSALVRLTPGGLESESSSPAGSSLGASSPFVIHKNKRSRSEYSSPAGASLTIEEEEYLRKKSKLADVQLGKETVLTESTIRQELISLYTSLNNVQEGTEFHTFLQTEKEGLLVKLAQFRSAQNTNV
jgi:hypothetical protein